ncbi:unconventional myosin-XVIIIb [Dromiciops gliroides]|uniref:unconventional myosin-XVIIIb n=1 Tax=Dromiciops gliroides TaxID=33562 RepID=UPI001CC6846B|nr:unconventional myosin-XVIIIb [Dromiciops gliroides]XP_043833418.1 unconventional myosin-XVIIIb [Dromiciops gliroides]XP_043833419.1 unconventional myosin-XVIIIb [Dromiciops gliroides]
MAISSRLALWEQKIREEDKSPPPTSPPPLFSVIPGGFIRQLVRETEKESKEARLKKQTLANSQEQTAPENSDSSAHKPSGTQSAQGGQPDPASPSPSVVENIPNEKEGMASPEPVLMSTINGESPQSKGAMETPPRKPQPLQRVRKSSDVLLMVAKLNSELTKPEQRTLRVESPTRKPPSPTPEREGKKKAQPPGDTCGPQKATEDSVEKAEKPRTASSPGSTDVPPKKNEKSQIQVLGKCGKVPQTKGPKGGKPLSKEDLETKPQAKGGEQGGGTEVKGMEDKAKISPVEAEGQPHTKVESADEPQSKLGKSGHPKDTVGTGKEVQSKAGKGDRAHIQMKKWGESLNKWRKRSGSQSQVGKDNKSQTQVRKDVEPQSQEAKESGPQSQTGKDYGSLSEVGKGDEKGSCLQSKEKKKDDPSQMEEGGRETLKEEKEVQGSPATEKEGVASENKEEAKETPEKMEEEEEEDEERGQSIIDPDKELEDRWYEAEKVWLVQKEGFTLATVLKPDVGTPDLAAGRVRLCIEADKSITEVDEENIHRANPHELDLAENLASLQNLNESSVLNTLQHRYQAQLPHTYTGPDLILLQPPGAPAPSSWKVPKGRRDGLAPHICSLAQKAYWAMLNQRQDQTIVPLGRSGSGKSTCCERVLEYLVGSAGSVDGWVSVEKIRATFTILRAFGSVLTDHSYNSTRFSMVMSLDFNATGRVTAAHLQTMLMERVRVAQQPEGEGNFAVFSQMLAGLDLDTRTELYLHQMAESHSFGMGVWAKPEEKQKAAVAFSHLQGAMETLGISASEQRAIWRVLAAIYHLGAAGACKVGRKQFMRFEWANYAAEVLGCEYEALTTAVFKHHLRQIILQATSRLNQPNHKEEPEVGPKMTGVECVQGMASGLYEELFSVIVSLINRSLASSHLSMFSIMVVDSPGFHNPRHQKKERAATFEELCHNYVHERLQTLFFRKKFELELERYREEKVVLPFDLPELSPRTTVAIIDQNLSQVHVPVAGQAEEPKGLLWVLDEEVRIEGSGDSAVMDRLCSAFEKKDTGTDEPPAFRKCEHGLQFEISHQLGQDPVRYDLSGWIQKAKPNLSALNAVQVLKQSSREDLSSLFLPRSRVPPVCQAVAGMEGYSQQALHRIGCVRKTFASSLAAVKRKAVCTQIILQMDALTNVIKRSQLHFIHCLVPTSGLEDRGGSPSLAPAHRQHPMDIPILRVQLAGAQVLDALRLHRIGYMDHMGFTRFRQRFQGLAPVFMKKLLLPQERMQERKLVEELLQELDLEKAAVLLGKTQVFLKSGVISRLERQREKLVSRNIILLQAACKGFLSRQQFKKLKIRQLAVQCIQRNLMVFQLVKDWPWWQLLCYIRPLLSITIGEDQLRAKEEELTVLRKKLETSEKSRNELRKNTDLLESKITDLTTELSDERFKGEVACRVLESERAERLRASREIQELKSKYEQTQKSLGSVEKQLEEAQQKIELSQVGKSHSGEADDWQTRFDCAQTEIEFLRKRLQMCEERLESELSARRELEEKLGEARNTYEEVKKNSHQLKRKCRNLTCDLEDTRVLLENQQSRNHELEKRQKKFDMQLTQALGESLFERGLREKLSQENASVRWELGKLQSKFEEREQETLGLKQKLEMLRSHNLDLRPSALPFGVEAVAALQRELWDLKSSALEQQQIQNEQETTIKKLEQLRIRFEMEIERMKQMHLKDQEDKEEELEDVRQSCQKRLRQLEMQLEQESEEKKMVLHEKQDLETLIGTLCEQIGHRDFDVEKRLRRDLRRTHALLSDVQLLLSNFEDSQTTVSKEELEKVHIKLEESEAKCADAQNTQKLLAQDLENMHSELENITRNKNLVDEQLYRLQLERADLLKRIDEDQEDLNELMKKHKELIAQSSDDITQIQELQLSLEETKKEKQSLQEKLHTAHSRIEHLEKTTVDRNIVCRQEAVICDLENKLEFHKVQIKRFEVLVIRLRDSALKMGEELEKAVTSEIEQKESCQYYQRRMEEMKAHMAELMKQEAETSRRCLDLEKRVEELLAVRLTLQADLEVSIRRIADLQAALEDVDSCPSDDSVRTMLESSPTGARREMDNQSLLESSIISQPMESIRSWLSSSPTPSPSRSSSTGRSLSQQSASGSGILDQRMHRETRDAEKSQPTSLRTDAQSRGDKSFVRRPISPFTFQGRDHSKTIGSESSEPWRDTVSKSRSRSSTTSPILQEKLPSSSWALSEFLEGFRRKRSDKERDALGTEDWPTLPIYQTTGASSLRRSLETVTLPEKASLESETESPRSGLLRSTSLKCLSSDKLDSTLSLPAPPKSMFRSCESLLESENTEGSFGRMLSSSVGDGPGKFAQSRLRLLRRPCIDAPLEEVEDPDLGKESLVFQNPRFSNLLNEPLESDSLAWKLPRHEQKPKVSFDDYVPAIRKSSSPTRARKDRGDGLKPGTSKSETSPDCLFPGSSGTFREKLEPKEDTGHLSDSSSSSSSAMSYRSADSIKSRPGSLKREEESDRRSQYGTWMDAKRQDEVESIMKKYLQK